MMKIITNYIYKFEPDEYLRKHLIDHIIQPNRRNRRNVNRLPAITYRSSLEESILSDEPIKNKKRGKRLKKQKKEPSRR